MPSACPSHTIGVQLALVALPAPGPYPLLLLASTSVPAAISTSSTLLWPLLAANVSAVHLPARKQQTSVKPAHPHCFALHGAFPLRAVPFVARRANIGAGGDERGGSRCMIHRRRHDESGASIPATRRDLGSEAKEEPARIGRDRMGRTTADAAPAQAG